MYGMGMPNPALWGLLAGVLNFIPYLGPAAAFLVIAGVAAFSFEETARIVLARSGYSLK
jgi:predicted PurR-regulated permease PerM